MRSRFPSTVNKMWSDCDYFVKATEWTALQELCRALALCKRGLLARNNQRSRAALEMRISQCSAALSSPNRAMLVGVAPVRRKGCRDQRHCGLCFIPAFLEMLQLK